MICNLQWILPCSLATKCCLIGFAMKSIEPGHAIFEMEADERHHNPMGTLHGGVYCDLADAAMGFAYASTLGEDETFTTIDRQTVDECMKAMHDDPWFVP